MEKQENNELKDLLKKYLDSTSMDSLISVSEVINMLDDSSTSGEQTEESVLSSADDHLTYADLYEKLFGDASGKKLTSRELSKELEEFSDFLKQVIHMCDKVFNVDETELEDSDNDDSSEDSVSVFDLDIKEADDIYDNLYDWGLEDADVSVDKDGNVLVYELFSDDIPHFTEAFNDAFSKDMSDQDITDYLKDAYNRYNSNKPLKDSYDEGYPIEGNLRNGRVFLKDMVVKFPPMDAVEDEYDLFSESVDGKSEPAIYHYYADGVKYIISKFPEKESFDMIDKRFPLYDDVDKQLLFSVSLDKMMVTGEKENFELNKLKYNDGKCQYYSFENGDNLFIIYKCYDINEFYLSNTINL